MEIKAKIIRLERAGMRYAFSIIWVIFSLMRLISSIDSYKNYIIDSPDIAKIYLKGIYLYSITIILFVLITAIFVYIDKTVKNKDKYLILEADTLYIPNASTNKVKEIKLDDIDHIGLTGFNQDTIKISMNVENRQFITSPGIYNIFDLDIKEIYNILNEILVKRQSNTV